MFVAETFGMAMLMMIVSTICWGSWANTIQMAASIPPRLASPALQMLENVRERCKPAALASLSGFGRGRRARALTATGAMADRQAMFKDASRQSRDARATRTAVSAAVPTQDCAFFLFTRGSLRVV